MQSSPKLKHYSALAAVFIISAASSDAQTNLIVYTDVDPDQLHDPDDPTYELDINNDGDIDFTLTANKTSSALSFSGVLFLFQVNSILISPASGNSIAGNYSATSSAGFALPSVLDSGDTIDNDLEWQTASTQYMAGFAALYTSGILAGTYSIGNWAGGATDKFLGLKFTAGDSIYYGWLRLDINDDNSTYVIKDYAYHTIAEEKIAAGQSELILVGLSNTADLSSVNIYAFNKTVYISSSAITAENNTIQIINTAGQICYETDWNAENTEINCSAFAEGIYFVRINADGKILNKEININ